MRDKTLTDELQFRMKQLGIPLDYTDEPHSSRAKSVAKSDAALPLGATQVGRAAGRGDPEPGQGYAEGHRLTDVGQPRGVAARERVASRAKSVAKSVTIPTIQDGLWEDGEEKDGEEKDDEEKFYVIQVTTQGVIGGGDTKSYSIAKSYSEFEALRSQMTKKSTATTKKISAIAFPDKPSLGRAPAAKLGLQDWVNGIIGLRLGRMWQKPLNDFLAQRESSNVSPKILAQIEPSNVSPTTLASLG